MKKIVIGMTGPTGSGKSTVGQLLRKKGFVIVDADKTARRVTEKGSATLGELCSAFGDDILLQNGELDRAALAAKAFADAQSIEKLNSITHPAIIELIKKEISDLQASGENRIILDAPQLFEAGADKLCDYVISVLADRETRLERIMVRDGISEEQANARINAQKSDSFFAENSSFVIYNNSDTEALQPQIEALIKELFGEETAQGEAAETLPIASASDTYEKTPEKASPVKKPLLFGAIALCLAVVAVVVVLLTRSKYTDVIDKSIALYKEPSPQTIEVVYPEQMWDFLVVRYSELDESIASADDIIDKFLLSQTQEIADHKNGQFGQEWEFEYEIISEQKLDKETINGITADINKTAAEQMKISKAMRVNLSYTISGSKTSDGFLSFTAVKINGEWYVVENIPEKGWIITVLEF